MNIQTQKDTGYRWVIRCKQTSCENDANGTLIILTVASVSVKQQCMLSDTNHDPSSPSSPAGKSDNLRWRRVDLRSKEVKPVVLALLLCSPVVASNWTEGADTQEAYAYAENELITDTGTSTKFDDDEDTTEPASAAPTPSFQDITTVAKSRTNTTCGAGRIISTDDYLYAETQVKGDFEGGTLNPGIDSADGESAGDGNAIQEATSSGAGTATGRMIFTASVEQNVEVTQDYTIQVTVGPSTVIWSYNHVTQWWSASGTYYQNDVAKNASYIQGRYGPALSHTLPVSWEVDDDEFIDIIGDVSTVRYEYSEDGTIVSRSAQAVARGELDTDIE